MIDRSIPQLSVRKNCVEEVPQHVDDKINVFFSILRKNSFSQNVIDRENY